MVVRHRARMWSRSYLVATLAVKQYPAQFNDFRRVLGHIYAMFVTGRGDMDDHISVQLGDRDCGAGHVDRCSFRGRNGV